MAHFLHMAFIIPCRVEFMIERVLVSRWVESHWRKPIMRLLGSESSGKILPSPVTLCVLYMYLWCLKGLAQFAGCSHKDSGWSSQLQKKWHSLLNYLATSHPFPFLFQRFYFSSASFHHLGPQDWTLRMAHPSFPSSIRIQISRRWPFVFIYLAQMNMLCPWTENDGSKTGVRNDSHINTLTL